MRRLTLATDDFNRADSTDLGANWDVYAGQDNLKIVTNRVRVGTINVNDCSESYNAVTPPADQWAQVTLASLVTPIPDRQVGGGVILRGAEPATLTFYGMEVGTIGGVGLTQVFKWVDGVLTLLVQNNLTIWVSGDILTGEVHGTSLQMFRNNVLLESASDGDIASGRVGMMGFVGLGGADTDVQLDDWSGGRFGPRQLLLGVGR